MYRMKLATQKLSWLETIIRAADVNTASIKEAPDPQEALIRTFEDANVVYAVWPEPDPTKERVHGHAIALVHGRHLMESHLAAGTNLQMRLTALMVDSHEDAVIVCRTYGDDRQNAA